MMSQELPSSMRILETSKLDMATIINKEKILFGISHTFPLSRNSKIDFFDFASELAPSSLFDECDVFTSSFLVFFFLDVVVLIYLGLLMPYIVLFWDHFSLLSLLLPWSSFRPPS